MMIGEAEHRRPMPASSSPKRTGGLSHLRVLHVGKFYPPHMGGIETHLEALCGELKNSLDLRVVVANDGPELVQEQLNGVSLSRVPTWTTLASTPVCPTLVGEIRRSAADILHIHLPNPMAVMAYLASGFQGPLVVTYHSDTVRQKVLGAVFAPFLHKALRRSAAIIASSPDYLRSSPVLARYPDRCHVIPFGIALDRFEQSDAVAVEQLRRQYGPRLVMSVGRLVYYKGFDYLIRAMAQVDGKLLIVGSGPLRQKLDELARELNVADKVVFLGKIPDKELIDCYHASDVFALASSARSEAFGLVQVEAMAAGLPVVNTQLDSGVPFVSVDEDTGLTVPPCDPVSLAGALNRLLNNPDQRREFGDAARRRARREFSLDVMTERTLALYEAVAKSRPSRETRSGA
jgi:glycosyltransferase involved in cell wall biosynthesis